MTDTHLKLNKVKVTGYSRKLSCSQPMFPERSNITLTFDSEVRSLNDLYLPLVNVVVVTMQAITTATTATQRRGHDLHVSEA